MTKVNRSLAETLKKTMYLTGDDRRFEKKWNIVAFSLLLCFASSLIVMSVLKVVNMNSAILDLGSFDSLFWNSSQNFEWIRFFFSHAQPFGAFFSSVYTIIPSPEMLVFLQALILVACIFFFHPRFCNYVKNYSLIFPIAFLFYFPVWYLALFDFHMDHLLVPLLFFFYYFCFKGYWWRAAIVSVSICLVKEPFALISIFCGLYLILRWRTFYLGFTVVIFGAFYFYFTTHVLIPQATSIFAGEGGYGAFSWMGSSPLEILIYIFKHPLDVIQEIVTNPRKMLYCGLLFGALAFIPLLSPFELIPTIPVLGISLLSSLENYYGIGHHYSAGLIAPMMIAFVCGYSRARRLFELVTGKLFSKRNASSLFFLSVIFGVVMIHILISPSPISRLFWTNKSWSYGVEAYLPSVRNTMIKRAIQQHIPEDPNVAISSQNTVNSRHLAHRRYYFSFPGGVNKVAATPEVVDNGQIRDIHAQYIVLDLKRPWYVFDQGCNWQTDHRPELTPSELERVGLTYNPGPLKWAGCAPDQSRQAFLGQVADSRKNYTIIFENDGFIIMGKK